MDKQSCDVCDTEAVVITDDLALCKYHADQAEVSADLQADRQQEDAELDNE